MNIQFLNNELFMNCVMIIYDLYNSAEKKTKQNTQKSDAFRIALSELFC